MRKDYKTQGNHGATFGPTKGVKKELSDFDQYPQAYQQYVDDLEDIGIETERQGNTLICSGAISVQLTELPSDYIS